VAYDLVVFDLDGTLIDESLTIEPGLASALRTAVGRGLRITIATGRMPAAVERYAAELEIRAPIIFYNGALIRDPETGEDLLSLHLPRGLLGRAWAAIAEAPVHPLFYRDDRLYCADRTPPIREYCEEEGLRVAVVDDPAGFLAQGSFVKSLLIGPPDALDVLRPLLEEVVGEDARLLRTRRNYLELVPPAASKGDALRRLAHYLEVPMERIISVGDQENDLDMLRAAGLGIAMPHAPEPVRRAADRVAPAPDAGGLVALLRELLPEHMR
jgi:Cof subfamily protein (haloacid dehalogenase superfamily)